MDWDVQVLWLPGYRSGYSYVGASWGCSGSKAGVKGEEASGPQVGRGLGLSW